jgi:hypothetical protein
MKSWNRLLRARLSKISSLPSREGAISVAVSDNGSRVPFEFVLLGFIS